MKFLVAVQTERRVEERKPLAVDTLVGFEGDAPVAALINDLSASGFGMIAVASLAAGIEVAVELPAVGTRAAIVVRGNDVRGNDVRFGCKFVTPLTEEELRRLALADEAQNAQREWRAAIGWCPGVPAMAA